MRGALGKGKEVLMRREYEKNLQRHLERLRHMRPISTGWEWTSGQPSLNQQKKHRMLEDKITQIQRENRHLLQKITHTINKRHSKDSDLEKMNRSLNYSFRKKQTESIDNENSKLLKRLQDKKSKYQAERMKQDWKKQKQVIKNIANFPFILRDGSKRPRRRTISKEMQASLITERKKLKSVLQLIRIKNIDGVDLVIGVRMDETKLSIIGDDKKNANLKIIEIPRDEALQFIEQQCEGKAEGLLDHLRYNAERDVLQLRSRQSHRKSKPESDQSLKQNKLLGPNLYEV